MSDEPTRAADSTQLSWISAGIEHEDRDEAAAGVAHAFRIGERWFLIPVGLVAEASPAVAVARLPFTAHWCLGLANIRGTLAPVYDLNRFLGAETSARLLLIVGQRETRACLLIDEITVLSVPPETQPAPFPALPNCPETLSGSALELEGRAYIQLDIQGLLMMLAQRATLLESRECA